MGIIKSFSLSIILLSSFNLFTMDHALISEIGNVCIKQEQPEDNILGEVWDKIDRDHVKVGNYVMNSHWHIRPFVGSLLSLARAYRIKPEQAEKKLWEIEVYISSKNNDRKFGKSLLNELVKGHWYVQYLMQVLEGKNLLRLEGVTGLNIDALQHNTHEQIVQEIAFSNARTTFFNNNLGKKLTALVPQFISDIHFTVLEHPHGNINPESLMMSDDGKYVQAKTEEDLSAAWDMQTGNIVDIHQIDVKEWDRVRTSYIDDSQQKLSLFGGYAYQAIERYRVVDKNDNYCAMMSDASMSIDAEFLPQEAQNNPKMIILYKRPQEVSYLCQKAFDNSYISIKELQALRESSSMQAIEGFPRKNLERVIDNQIKALTIK